MPNEQKHTDSARHQEILAIAAETFFERGYDGTSIQEIADRAGILKGSLYHHIESKDHLLFEVIDGFHREGYAQINELFVSDAPAIEVLHELIRRHIRHNADNHIAAGVFHRDFRSLSRERQERVVRGRDPYEVHLRGLLARGQREGAVSPRIDPKLASLAILNSMNSVYTWYRPGGRNTAEQVADAYADFIVAGLRGSGMADVRAAPAASAAR